jgi:F-type H+-transporting ATPase subunit gamma
VSASQFKLKSQISVAGDLHSVVKTMKALAASSIGQYEKSVIALNEYTRFVELGIGTCLRDVRDTEPNVIPAKPLGGQGAIVFGSDQGLVGQFNRVIADFAIQNLSELPEKPKVWAVGERVNTRLLDAGVHVVQSFNLPNTVDGIVPLVEQLQVATENPSGDKPIDQLKIFHNRPRSGSLYEPVVSQLLPLDDSWKKRMIENVWPTKSGPDILGGSAANLPALVLEYLFISIFQACAESLASENRSRLAAMERADKNIDHLLTDLHTKYQRIRQTAIDEELFDVVSGFSSLGAKVRPVT